MQEMLRDVGLIPGSGRSPWRREWLPTSVFSPGESHGQRSLAGYSAWGHKESDTTEQLSLEAYRLPMIAAFRLIIWAKMIKIIKI